MNRPFFSILYVCALAVILAGCRQPEEIQTHRVESSRSGLESLAKSFNRQPSAPRQKSRLVAAMVSRPDATWFFKLNGPVEEVNAAEPEWREFFATLTFEDTGQPQWKLPEGWSDGGVRKGMFSTIKLINLNDQQPPLQMEVSSMSANQPLKSNVDRWRGQLGLEPVEGDDLGLESLDYDGGTLKLFDEIGFFSGGMTPPFAGGMGGAPSAPEIPSEPVSDTKPTPPPFQFESPAGWSAGPTSSIVKVRLLKQDGDDQAQLTVTELGATNEWQVNAMEWASQVGFDDVTVEQLAERTRAVTVDGILAQQIRLIEDDDRFERAILAVMFKRDESAWFVKMAGARDLVAANEQAFTDFIQSIKFDR